VPESPIDLVAAAAAADGDSSSLTDDSSRRGGRSCSGSGVAAARAGAALGRSAASGADRWAVGQLAASGEEALGRVYLPQYLLLALCILLPPLGAFLQAPSLRRMNMHSRHITGIAASRLCSPQLTRCQTPHDCRPRAALQRGRRRRTDRWQPAAGNAARPCGARKPRGAAEP
jgi:hypothetical protein